MTTTMTNVNPSSIAYGRESIVYNNQGIDTIELMANYKAVNNPNPAKYRYVKREVNGVKKPVKVLVNERFGLVQTLGLIPVKNTKGLPVTDTIKRIKRDAKKEGFKAVVEVFKHSKGRSLSSYLIVSRMTSKTTEYDRTHKKCLGTHCLLTFAGLHQPTKKLHSQSMSMIKKFLERKTFYVSKLDIAIDVTNPKPINHKRKESFKKLLKPYSKHGVIALPNGATSLYINKVNGSESISRILYYDKYHKQSSYHGQTLLSSLKNWKRIEVTLTFNLNKKNNRKSFKAYVSSMQFYDYLMEIDHITQRINHKGYSHDYLNYQINSFLDGRTINNKESLKQFNSLKSLERFKKSEYRRYMLPI